MKRPPGVSCAKRRDGSASWRYRFKHGKESDGKDRYVTRAGFDTMREAVEAMALEKARRRMAPRIGGVDKTFGQFFLEWLDYAGSAWAPSTRQVNRHHANRAISRFGDIALSKITTELLDREQRELLLYGKKTNRGRTALSAKAVKETFTLVKAALRRQRNGTMSLPIQRRTSTCPASNANIRLSYSLSSLKAS